MSNFWDNRDDRPITFTTKGRAKHDDFDSNETFLEKYRSFNNVLIVDTNSTTDEEADFDNIQMALDEAKDTGYGYHIFIRNGTYNETLDNTQDGVTLEGENKSQTILKNGTTTHCLYNSGDYVTVKSLTLTKDTQNGFVIDISTSENFSLIDCNLNSDQVNHMLNCNHDLNYGTYDNYLIKNCYFYNSAADANSIIKFYCYSATGVTNATTKNIHIINNKIVANGNIASDNAAIQIQCLKGTDILNSVIEQVVISGNRIYVDGTGSTNAYGIYMSAALDYRADIREVSINDNLISVTGATNNYGIAASAYDGASITYLEIGEGNNIIADENKEVYILGDVTEYSTGGYWLDTWTPAFNSGASMGYIGITYKAFYSIVGRTCFIRLYSIGETNGIAEDYIQFTVPIVFKDATSGESACGSCMVGITFLQGLFYNSGTTKVSIKRYDNAVFPIGANTRIGIDFAYEI